MKKILIIEDSRLQAKMAEEQFTKEGYEVVLAADGKEGVQKAVSEKPDLVVIDTILPDIDGFEVCRQIKANEASSGTKTIVTTGSINAVDAGKAREAGADDYAVKTADYGALVKLVTELVGK